MKHISIVTHGSFLGITGERLSIYENEKKITDFPLSKIKTIRSYGYAILTTYIWNCIINAGMEPCENLKRNGIKNF